MSHQARQRIEVALLALLFGAGAGWGAFQWQLSDMAAHLKRIDERVSAMYCGSLPPDKQPGCR